MRLRRRAIFNGVLPGAESSPRERDAEKRRGGRHWCDSSASPPPLQTFIQCARAFWTFARNRTVAASSRTLARHPQAPKTALVPRTVAQIARDRGVRLHLLNPRRACNHGARRWLRGEASERHLQQAQLALGGKLFERADASQPPAQAARSGSPPLQPTFAARPGRGSSAWRQGVGCELTGWSTSIGPNLRGGHSPMSEERSNPSRLGRRAALRLFASVAGISLLAACGPGAAPAAQPTSASAPKPTAPPAAAGQATPAAGAGTTSAGAAAQPTAAQPAAAAQAQPTTPATGQPKRGGTPARRRRRRRRPPRRSALQPRSTPPGCRSTG